MLLLAVAVFFLASVLALYSYGHFAKRVQGPPAHALAVADDKTAMDRMVAPLIRAYPDQSGLVLLADNLDAFAVRLLSAREAQRSLDLQYYLWHDDLTGQLLGFELLRAADRGVRIRLLLDDMNVHDKDTVLAALDQHPNIDVRVFNPTRGRQSTLRRGVETLLRGFSVSRRMHNKAWIADGRLAVVGGRNIGNEYFDAAETNFFDVDLAMIGSAVAQTEEIFDTYWNSRAVIPFSALVKLEPDAVKRVQASSLEMERQVADSPYMKRVQELFTLEGLLRKHQVHWSGDVHVYSDPPEKLDGQQKSQWLISQLLPAWEGARESLEIISPYFVPGTEGVRRFHALRDRGVKITILTNSLAATDVIMVHGGYAPYRKPLLEQGIGLFELMPFGEHDRSLLGSSGTSLHTKAFMVDGSQGFVGSFNFDPRSAWLNTEMGVMFREPAIVKALQEIFVERTGPHDSYRLFLKDGDLRWEDGSVVPPRIWDSEPESGFWSRFSARVVSWLPIESQL